MSLEELSSDYNAVQAKIDGLNAGLTTPVELVAILKNDVVPLMGALVRELAEVDETVADLYSNAEDILQPETAGVFSALILTGRSIVGAVYKSTEDLQVKTACKEWLKLSKEAEAMLEEITVPDDPEDEGDDDDDGDSSDDDDDDNDQKEDK